MKSWMESMECSISKILSYKNLAKSTMFVLSLEAIIMMIDALLKTVRNITVPFLLLSGIVIVATGVILTFMSLKRLRIRI